MEPERSRTRYTAAFRPLRPCLVRLIAARLVRSGTLGRATGAAVRGENSERLKSLLNMFLRSSGGGAAGQRRLVEWCGMRPVERFLLGAGLSGPIVPGEQKAELVEEVPDFVAAVLKVLGDQAELEPQRPFRALRVFEVREYI